MGFDLLGRKCNGLLVFTKLQPAHIWIKEFLLGRLVSRLALKKEASAVVGGICNHSTTYNPRQRFCQIPSAVQRKPNYTSNSLCIASDEPSLLHMLTATPSASFFSRLSNWCRRIAGKSYRPRQLTQDSLARGGECGWSRHLLDIYLSIKQMESGCAIEKRATDPRHRSTWWLARLP